MSGLWFGSAPELPWLDQHCAGGFDVPAPTEVQRLGSRLSVVEEVGVAHCGQELVALSFVAYGIQHLDVEPGVGLAEPSVAPAPNIGRVPQRSLVRILLDAGPVATDIHTIGVENANAEPFDLLNSSLHSADFGHAVTIGAERRTGGRRDASCR